MGTGDQKAPVVGVGAITSTNGGVFFHIYGKAGSSRINLDILGEDQADDGNGVSTLVIGDDPNLDDQIIIYFFDQQTNAVFDMDGIYTDGDASDTASSFGVYSVGATVTDNTLCVNATNWTDATIKANMDSKDDKFTFIPSNPQIAHITSRADLSIYDCKGKTCGLIPMGSSPLQGTGTCRFFDNETTEGYCVGTHSANRLIIQTTGTFDNADMYQIESKIYVNGKYDDNGVYFSNTGIATGAYVSAADACAGAILISMGGKYKLANGSGASPATPMVNTCSVSSGARATYMISDETSIFTGPSFKYLYIDFPSFNYDLNKVKEVMARDGQVKVEVHYTILKAPCGTLYSGTHCIGSFTAQCTKPTFTLLYPYFTQMDATADVFWDGIAITNISDASGTATLTVYEDDGDVATVTTGSIGGHSMYVDLLSNLYGGMTLTKTTGGGVLGDSRCYIVVCTDFNADGFAMIANTASGESLGYLPRFDRTGLCP
jgi:hypothetical protein